MLVLAIMAVVLTLALPAMGGLLQAARLRSTRDALLDSLSMARMEAVRRNSRVVLCKSADGVDCSTTGDWSQGWIIFNDRNNNLRRDTDEPLMTQERGLPRTVRITGNQPIANYVSYGARGTARLQSGAFQSGTFTICSTTQTRQQAFAIPIRPSGRARPVNTTLETCAPATPAAPGASD